jgi:DNA-binding transcriptional LysR family regulator
MELRQLICVEAVVRHRHFTRAADELHIAQSALSHQIGRLERELGIPLFERTSRRVTPTEAGEAVAFRARRVMAELEATRQEVDQLRGVLRGHIWVGALVPAGDVDVPGLLAQFSQAFPGVEISLREGIAGRDVRPACRRRARRGILPAGPEAGRGLRLRAAQRGRGSYRPGSRPDSA